MTTDLVQATPAGAAANYDAEFAAAQQAFYNEDGSVVGLEDMEGEQFGLPRLSIIQKDNKAKELGVPKGQLYHTATQTAAETVKVIVLGIVKGRSWMPDYDPKADDVEPKCRSVDGIKPDNKYVKDGTAPASSCATCEKAQWDRDKDLPPDCAEQWHLIGVMPDEEVPFVFTCRKTAVKAVKTYAQAFKWSKRPMFTVYTEITSKPAADGQDYFVPTIKALKLEPVPVEQLAGLSEMAKLFRARMHQQGDEAPAEQPAAQPSPQQAQAQPAPKAEAAPAAASTPAAQPASSGAPAPSEATTAGAAAPTTAPAPAAQPAAEAAPAAPAADDDDPDSW